MDSNRVKISYEESNSSESEFEVKEESNESDEDNRDSADSELDVKDEPDEDEDDNRDSGGTGTINDLESRLQVDAVKIEEDSADDADESEENTSSGDEESKAGLASVFADILRKKATSKTVILSKGDTDKQIAKRKRLKEQKDEDGEAPYKYAHLNLSEQQAKRKEWEELGHIKPHVLDKEKEGNLKRTATRGVVQLFNAVRTHQKSVEDQVKTVGSSEFKQEKILKSLNKGDFLDMLKGKSPKGKTADTTPVKTESEENPKWSILRDDYMMGAKMKDWDKESDSDDEMQNENINDDDFDGSDSDT